MSTYLVVMDRPVPAQSLRYGLLNRLSADKAAQFVLLQTLSRLPGESEEEARRAARDNLNATASLLSKLDLPVIDTVVGDALPRKAIAQEMAVRTYDGIVLTTKASKLLSLIGFDLAHQLQRKFRIPVVSFEPLETDHAAAA